MKCYRFSLIMIVCGSLSGIVSIVTVWAGCSGVQIQVGARDFSLLQNVKTVGPIQPPYSVGTGVQPWE